MILENIELAFSSLMSNKMRALLTMLGIIIGIMSIIAIMIIGDAMTASVSGSLSSLGAGNITLSVQERTGEGDNEGAGDFGAMSFDRGASGAFGASGASGASRTGKTPQSGDLISDRMIDEMRLAFADRISGVSINYSAGSAQVKERDLYANISINGVNADYIDANNIAMLSGSFISETDVKSKSQVAVVSDKFAQNIFPGNEEPIGQIVKLYKQKNIELYTIVGVYQYEQMGYGGSTASERDITTTFYIPVSTAKLDILEKNYSNITVIGSENSEVGELTGRLQAYFNNIYGGNKNWRISVTNMESMLSTVTSTLNTISIAIAFIAGISLLVGGIGVMNIMLVSVTERTREIGTRKALGATKFHIQLQFVTEAIIIASVGGIIGLLLGVGLGAIITSFFSVPLVLSPIYSIGSVLFSMAVGVFFGIYPAGKAAKLDPIEALRYE